MFRSIFPILSTPDIERALVFYRDLLRGTVEYSYPPGAPPGTVPEYVAVRIGHSSIGISRDAANGNGAPTPTSGSSLWVYVDDCDHAVEVLTAAGVRVVAPPEDQPWGERMARVLDPDGRTVLLGQEGTAGTEEPTGPTGLS